MYVVQTATVGSILKSVLGTYSTQYLFEIILFSDPPPLTYCRQGRPPMNGMPLLTLFLL